MPLALACSLSHLHLHLVQLSQESSNSSGDSGCHLFDGLDEGLPSLLVFCIPSMRDRICSTSFWRWLVWAATAALMIVFQSGGGWKCGITGMNVPVGGKYWLGKFPNAG